MKRIFEVSAMMLVGDSVLGILVPRRHSLLRRGGPEPWRRLMRAFAEWPAMTSTLAAAEFGAGLWLAARRSA